MLVQAADIIAGTLARVHEKERYDVYSEKFYTVIKDRVLYIEQWPKNYGSLFYQQEPTKEYDRSIQIFAEKQALTFISKNEKSRDDDTQKRVQTLRFLLYQNRFDRVDGYVSSDNIINFLQETLGVGNMSRQTLRNNVIAKLRDDGVLISSCTEGYKIPVSYKDVVKYVEQINTKVIPMLNRLGCSRKQIKMLTDNMLDIVDKEEFANLNVLLDRHEDYQSNMNFVSE